MELVDGLEALQVHPVAHLDLERQVVGAVAQQAEVIMATSAPASSTLRTSVAVWTPVEAASDTCGADAGWRSSSSGRVSSVEVLSCSFGCTSMASMSRSGW